MLQKIRQAIVQNLWQVYRTTLPQVQQIETALKTYGVAALPLDHFAVIDLPGPHTGIPQLAQIFSALDFMVRGRGYLAEKQNEFWWLAESNSEKKLAIDALPQIVVADFHLDKLPLEIKKIIEKYAAQASAFPMLEMQKLIKECAIDQLCVLIVNYFSGRDWSLPTATEFKMVQEFNELLAWVLIFGRKPNHFTLSAHLLPQFESLSEFNQFLISDLQFDLNEVGGMIKGSALAGIEQSSTIGMPVTVQLSDGQIELAGCFVEFVWRHPKNNFSGEPLMWCDYFSDFIGNHANNVIESLYNQESIV